MVNLSSIAVFVLSTTKRNMGGYKQDYSSYYESRVLPIANSWGSVLPYFYFVMGTNKFDHQFIAKHCSYGDRRRLAPHAPQTESRDAIELYSCPKTLEERRIHANLTSASTLSNIETSLISKSERFNVLFTANCTGEYFGMGPTCRCQESMRYFLYEPTLSDIQWFLFLDDDTYIRPFSLLALLDSIEHATGDTVHKVQSNRPIAMVAPGRLRNFEFSKGWKGMYDCDVKGVHEFLCAQPALMNRLAINAMSSAINSNGLTALQKIWGGSHDTLLGVLLWMYSIPTYSFQYSYQGSEVLLDSTRSSFINALDSSKKFIVHCVRNHLRYKKSAKSGNPEVVAAVASQYNIAHMFGDLLLYTSNSSSSASTAEDLAALKEKQRVIGSECFNQLTAGSEEGMALQSPTKEESGIMRTVFRPHALQLRKTFRPFRPEDCPLLDLWVV